MTSIRPFMGAYYNENDPFAAAWLRELIKADMIAPGEIDERSIEEVQPEDLNGFTQCHFFGGIGTWSYALRAAGWPDSRECWTGSCPCQPLSGAGKRKGHIDERHLWPAFYRLIAECKPTVVLGEQVASKIGREWLSAVRADLESLGYACGAADLPAASVAAPHIRQRLYFVANANSNDGSTDGGWSRHQWSNGRSVDCGRGETRGMADALRSGRQQERRGAFGDEKEDGRARRNGREPDGDHFVAGSGEVGGVENAERLGRRAGNPPVSRPESGRSFPDNASELGKPDDSGLSPRQREEVCGSGWREEGRATQQPSRSFWSNAEWIYCRDGKWRPVEPAPLGLAPELAADLGCVRLAGGKEVFFPLIQKGKNRVGRLRGYGNALCAETAIAFIEAYLAIDRTNRKGTI